MRLLHVDAPTQRDPGEQWRTGLERLFGEGVKVTPGADFRRGELSDWPVEGASLLDARSDAQHLTRAASRDGYSSMISVILQLEGQLECALDSSFSIAAGMAFVCDTGRPMQLSMPGHYRQLMLLLPRTTLLLDEAIFDTPLDPEDPIDELILRHLYALARGAELSARDRHAHIGVIKASLPAASIVRRRRGPLHVRVRRALAQIESGFARPELSPVSIAAAQGVSRRHLDALVARRGTSLSRLIRERRLSEAARLLRAHDHAEQSISSIAHAVGFKSSAHFSRAFRQRFELSPAQWRACPRTSAC